MMISRTTWRSVLAALLLAPSAARADLGIGVALPRTGPVAAIGDQVANGADAAARDVGVELICYDGYRQETGVLVRQGAEHDFGVQWFATSGMASREFAAIAGPAGGGVLLTFNPDPRRREAAAVRAFRAQGIDP